MKIYLSVTFVLVVILLILFIAVNGPKLFRMIRKFFTTLSQQKKKEKTVEPVTMANPNTESPRMRRNPNANQNQYNLNRTSSIFTVTGTEYDTKTVSTPISRHPAEDTLTSTISSTDFSYDNKALQLTPVSTEKPKIETNF
jgi:predicted PurR-regulated permease PerM